MVVTVVIFNFALALLLLYLAWRVRRLRRRLARITNTLTMSERSTYAALHIAPKAVYTGKQSIQQLKQRREPLQLQLQRVQQFLMLVDILQQVGLLSFSRFSPSILRRKAKTLR